MADRSMLSVQRPMMSKFKMAMLLFVSSEAVFFAMLILAFCDFNGVKMPGPDAKQERTQMRFWLAATIALGMAFLYGEAKEWNDLIHKHVTISRDLFGSTFFTLTGFHGLHVIMGLIILSTLFLLTFSSKRRDPSHHAFEAVSIYWHFVDIVWIFIFSVVYIWATR
jgi:heme/copper-type cytochrome/quinol oxidase subunit 3